jgi:putative ABC transport system ATP-binding protein
MAAILEAIGLQKHYKMGQAVVRALDGITMSLEQGQFLGMLGTSGSGKSTLLNLIGGLDRPTAGILRVFGQDLAEMSREELSLHRRKNVGMIFQSFNLIPTMPAVDNVALAMMFAGVPRAERDRRALELLRVVGLADRQAHKPSELSGGEQQRVAIARALANEPAILLADEPTGNLDSHTAHEILDILRQLNEQQKKTIIVVTHDAMIAGKYAHRTVTLLDGRIIQESSALKSSAPRSDA